MSARIPNGLQCAPASAEVRAMRQACLAGLDVTMSGEQPPTPQQRQRQPPQRFSPADYASPTVDRPKRKRKLVLEPRSPPTSTSIVQSFPAPPVQHCAAPLPAAVEPLGGTSGAYRCPVAPDIYRFPFVTCTRHRPASPGWPLLKSVLQHISSCHLVNGERVPQSFLEEHKLSICQPCKTFVTARGCPVATENVVHNHCLW